MHRPAHHNTDVRPLTERVSFHIASVVDYFTKLLYVVMGLAVAGLGMKYYAVTGGSFVFIFATGLLSLLFLLQIILSFFYVIANLWLALLGAFCSLSLVLGFLAMMFRYQDWTGWQIMYFMWLPLFLFTAIFLGIYLPKRSRLPKPHRHFLFRNLIGPFLFTVVLAITAVVTNVSKFNTRDEGDWQQSPTEARPDTGTENGTDSDTTGLWRAY